MSELISIRHVRLAAIASRPLGTHRSPEVTSRGDGTGDGQCGSARVGHGGEGCVGSLG